MKTLYAKVFPYTLEDDATPDTAMTGLSMLFFGRNPDDPEHTVDRIPTALAEEMARRWNSLFGVSQGLYRHIKTGGLYEVLSDTASIEADMSPAVVYRSTETGRVFVRPHSEFFDGRFERLDPAAKPAA